MGILDGIEKILGTVDRTTSAADRGIRGAEKAKQISDKVGGAVGKVLEKKCKYCQTPLKTDMEKKKEMCMNCALSRA